MNNPNLSSPRRRRTERSPRPAPAPLAADEIESDVAAQVGENERLNAEETAEKRRKREKWERYYARERAELHGARRALFTAFWIWTICPHAECQRARACVGDTDECVTQRWRVVVPDRLRVELAKIFKLIADGHSREEACRLAREDMEQHDKAFAEIRAKYPGVFPDEEEEET